MNLNSKCCDKCINTDVDEFSDFVEFVAENIAEVHLAKYGGSFLTRDGDAIFIKKVVYNNPKVIVFWNDGTKSIASCCEAESSSFSFEAGLNIAINNRLYGREEMNRLYSDWLPTRYYKNINSGDAIQSGDYTVTIKDVRKYYKDIEETERQQEQKLIADTMINYLKSCGYTISKTQKVTF